MTGRRRQRRDSTRKPTTARSSSGCSFVVNAGTARRKRRRKTGLSALSAETVLHTKIARRRSCRSGRGGQAVRSATRSVPTWCASTIEARCRTRCRRSRTTSQRPSPHPTRHRKRWPRRGRDARQARDEDDQKNPLVVGLQMLRRSYYAGRRRSCRRSEPPAGLAGLHGDDVARIHRHPLPARKCLRNRDRPRRRGRHRGRRAPPSPDCRPATEPLAPIETRPLDAAGKEIITRRDIGIPVRADRVRGPLARRSRFRADAGAACAARVRARGAPRRRCSAISRAGSPRSTSYDVKPATLTVALNGGRVDPTLGLSAVHARSLRRAAALEPFSR